MRNLALVLTLLVLGLGGCKSTEAGLDTAPGQDAWKVDVGVDALKADGEGRDGQDASDLLLRDSQGGDAADAGLLDLAAPETSTEVKDLPVDPGACAAAQFSKVTFGGRPVGEEAFHVFRIENCGTVPMKIYQIKLQEGSSPDFSMDYPGPGAAPTPENPLVIAVGESAGMDVVFLPAQEAIVGEDGSLVLETGTLVVVTNSPAGPLEVPVSGVGVVCETWSCCPAAVIDCDQGSKVPLGTTLHLHGENSYATSGLIARRKWLVDQPDGSQGTFMPNDAHPTPQFEVNVPGTYVFRLTVWDEQDSMSCIEDTIKVVVLPER